jgi:hypothetical protein
MGRVQTELKGAAVSHGVQPRFSQLRMSISSSPTSDSAVPTNRRARDLGPALPFVMPLATADRVALALIMLGEAGFGTWLIGEPALTD